MYKLGIDLGGTKIEGVVLDASGHPVFRHRVPTEREKGYDHILSRIKTLYLMLAGKIENRPHSFGIGTPGAVSHKTGVLKNSNSTCLNGRLSRKEIENLIGHAAGFKNDANCFAMAEARCGAGKGKDMVFGVIMGTGCGGGIVSGGNVRDGLQDIAGEWGHMSIDPNGPVCYCGMKGCVETFISGRGVENRYEEKFGHRKALPEIVSDFRLGDAKAAEIMNAFFLRFGRAVANLINIIDPDVIVLGGGVSNIDELYTRGIEEVRRQVFSDSLETPVRRNELGDSAGVIGAALIGL